MIDDIEDVPSNKFSKGNHTKKMSTYTDLAVSPSQYDDIRDYILEGHDILDWNKFSMGFQRRHHYSLSKNMLRYVYVKETNKPPPRELIKKACRSQYGILNVCVFTSAYPEYTDENGVLQKQQFSCKHNCYYCPAEPNQPRSYLMDEPGVARANECGFDCVKQFHMRLKQYKSMGHPLDKIEFEVSGGTWSEYPRPYQRDFIRDGYYAANTYGNAVKREPLSLDEEIELNEKADIHIIGLTIETRPDAITLDEMALFRKYNVTRVQIGVQHTDNRVLQKINRGHTVEQSMEGIKLLLDNGFKVDIHLMPMLPLATPEMDKKMFDEVLKHPNLQVDQWKVYPTSVVPWSVLEEWYAKGKYKPYSMDKLIDVLIYMKKRVHNRIRLIRIVRDINEHYILGGCKNVSLRQVLHKQLENENTYCKCIRCRSAKDSVIDQHHKLKIDKFKASGGTEYFISYVSNDEKVLYGFCRLRLPPKNAMKHQLDEVKGYALIRELHVYSALTPVNDKRMNKGFGIQHKGFGIQHKGFGIQHKGFGIQHKGFGKKLLKHAERIACVNLYRDIAVISGVGVRDYYRKRGYELESTYMLKRIGLWRFICNVLMYVIISFIN
jgi:ELP3 family radical SAM enzyme/protein acetyltransferase